MRHAKAPELPVVLLEDIAALIGLVFALFGVGLTAITGNSLFDAIGTLMIGTLLIVVAITLGIETKSLLVGEGATDADHDKIVAAITGGPEVEHLIHIKTLYLGPDELLVAAKLGFAGRQAARPKSPPTSTSSRRGCAEAVPTARAIYFEPDVYRATRLPAPADRRGRHPVGRLTPRGDARLNRWSTAPSPSRSRDSRYDEQLAFALATERAGFDGFFRSDHYMRMGAGDPLPGPTDAWTTLAGLARETTAHPARHAGLLRHPPRARRCSRSRSPRSTRCRAAASSSGWAPAGSRREHRAYGIPFPAKRFGLLEEQLEIVTGLWSTPVGETFDFAGEHYTLAGAPALPKPRQAARADHRRRRRPAPDARRSRRGSRPSSTSASGPSPRSPERSPACARRASASTATRRR